MDFTSTKGLIQVLLVFGGNKQVTVPPEDHAHQVKPQKKTTLGPFGLETF